MLKICLFITLLAYLLLVFAAFNTGVIDFLLNGAIPNDWEISRLVKKVYYGLGILLAVQPILSTFLLWWVIRLGAHAPVSLKRILVIYSVLSIGVCLAIFLYAGWGLLPRIPTAS